MFISPYDTTALRSYKVDRIIKDLEEAIISMDGIITLDNVYYVTNKNKDIKPFGHPIYIKDSYDENKLVSDSRGVANVRQSDGELVGDQNFEYMKLRCDLIDKVWADGSEKDLYNASDLSIRIFSIIITSNLAKRLNLEDKVRNKLQMISAFYYICLFDDDVTLDERSIISYAKKINRVTGIPAQDVVEYLESTKPMSNVHDFVNEMIHFGDTVRLEKLSAGALFTMLGGTWFGPNANEHVAVAIEHPPTFIAMCYTALTNRSYRKTQIYELTKRFDRDFEMTDQFTRNIKNLLR